MCIFRLLWFIRIRVTQLVIVLGQGIQQFLGAAYDPHWFTSPFNPDQLTGFHLADVYLYRGPGRFRLGTGIPGLDKRHCGKSSSNPTHDCG
ncbi:hypothetical protein GCM10022394_22210 [Zobellella aerophila]|uniref:Secreted protein n=1 Tax=Zobellella aerophila TaxID=870480 RepID=A0ABP6VX63_9GAMM